MGREEGDATASKQEVNPEAEIEQPHEQDVSTAFLWRPYNKRLRYPRRAVVEHASAGALE